MIENSGYTLDLNSLGGIGNKLTFVNMDKTKETFLKTVEMVNSNVTNSLILSNFDEFLKNIDRKLHIFFKKLSNSHLLQLLINEDDKDYLYIKFVPSRNIRNSFYILNKEDKVLLMIDYDFTTLSNNSRFSLMNIFINFLRITELRGSNNAHFNHQLNYFKNKLADVNDFTEKANFQLKSINAMKKNLCIHMVIEPYAPISYTLISKNKYIMNYKLKTRYLYSNKRGYSYLPYDHPITDDLNHFYKYMDIFWDRKLVEKPSLVMTNARIIKRYLTKNKIVNSYLSLQPNILVTGEFDAARLYFFDDVFFIKVTDKMNLSLLGDEYIYIVGMEHQQLYKLNDFIVNRDDVLLVLNMLTI